jgi:hypothetical protein
MAPLAILDAYFGCDFLGVRGVGHCGASTRKDEHDNHHCTSHHHSTSPVIVSEPMK